MSLPAPPGFEHTGESRKPAFGEWFQTDDGEAHRASVPGVGILGPDNPINHWPILRPVAIEGGGKA